MEKEKKKRPLTKKKQRFVDEYLVDFNATQAAIRTGYSAKTAHAIGWQLKNKPDIAEAIDQRIEDVAVGRNERLKLLSEIARYGEKDSDRLNAIGKLGELAGDYEKKIAVTGNMKMNIVDIDYGLNGSGD